MICNNICFTLSTVTFEDELEAIQGQQDFPHKETEQSKWEHQKHKELDWEGISKTIGQSSRTIEVIYSSESQERLLTRVYFSFDPKVNVRLFTLTITVDPHLSSPH